MCFNAQDLEELAMFPDAKNGAGTGAHVFERSASKQRITTWTDETAKEDAIMRAVTFLEDALGYRWAGSKRYNSYLVHIWTEV